MLLCGHDPLLCLCCFCHQEVECIFLSFWFVLASWIFLTNANTRTYVLGFLRWKFKRVLASAFTQKNHSHVKKPRLPCSRETPGEERCSGREETMWRERACGRELNPRHMRKPSEHQRRNNPALLANPLHFVPTQHSWQTSIFYMSEVVLNCPTLVKVSSGKTAMWQR